MSRSGYRWATPISVSGVQHGRPVVDVHGVASAAWGAHLRAAVEGAGLERDNGAGWSSTGHFRLIELWAGRRRDEPAVIGVDRHAGVPVRFRGEVPCVLPGKHVRRAKPLWYVDEIDEHLHLQVPGGAAGGQQRVVEVVTWSAWS